MKQNVYLVLFSFIALACSKPVHQEIQKTIEANQKARGVTEWETSKSNPRIVFEKLRDEYKRNPQLGKEVCGSLVALSGQDLSIFESEINSPENSFLFKTCHDQLKGVLEEYWQKQKKYKPNTTDLNFQFKPRIAKRDLSKGYRAATGDVQPKELVLTFDDGPDRDLTPQILAILKKVNARVMFFTLGKQVKLNPWAVYLAANDGHSVGSHSFNHQCLANNVICANANKGKPLAMDDAIAEIRRGHQAIYDVLGFVEPFFRFPYGESDHLLSAYLADRQVAQMFWNVDSADWKAQTNEQMLTNVLGQIDKVQRGIVLFHDVHRRTLEVLPDFLRAIYDRGYSLVVLQSMDDQARYNSPLVTKTPIVP